MFLANNGKGSGGSGGGGSGGGGGFFGMFGGSDAAKKDPIDQCKQWKRDLQKEIRRMDRDIADIKRAEQKSITECKTLAKKGRVSAVKVLAKEIANTRRTVERMYIAKAQLNSVSSSLQTSMCKETSHPIGIRTLVTVLTLSYPSHSIDEDAGMHVEKRRNHDSNE